MHRVTQDYLAGREDGILVELEAAVWFEEWPETRSDCLACGQPMDASNGPFLHQHVCPQAAA
jgi:hypothetical protein